ncbi:hypothetical protein BDZ89DRAFT_947880 [Hymenopellis radicata]|nr:hypothetical protein BDZ89DRAFT_947880 [Hymenopellis radicata]
MLPSYSSSSAPEYTPSPSEEEATLDYTPRYPLAHAVFDGNFTQRWKQATLILKDQDEKAEIPCYGRHSIIHGELGLLKDDISCVTVKLEGRLNFSISDVGSNSWTLVSEKYTLWKKDDNIVSRCPSVLPLSIRFPLTFQDAGEAKKLPPSYEAMFYGVPSLWVTCTYTISVTISRTRARYGLWKPSQTYTLRINYRPRSRPNRPIVRFDTIFSMLKYVPEEWHQIMDAMHFKPSACLTPINCHFLIPSVQTFGLEDVIPFHIQLTGPLESLSHVFPTPSSEDEQPTQKLFIRVCLVRKTLLVVDGRKYWRNRSLGEGKVWATPPHAPTCHADLLVSADWEGEVRCNPEVRTAGFNIGNVAVQDFILFALTPPNVRNALLLQLQHAHPVKLVTDTWTDDTTTHPHDI